MSLIEEMQQKVITAHIRATISYVRDMQVGESPEDALMWASNAALTVEGITLEGSHRIAGDVAREYQSYHLDALARAGLTPRRG